MERIKPFLTNKGYFSEDEISIEISDELVSDEKVLTEIFNKHCINIKEKSSGTKPSSLGDSTNRLLDEITVGQTIDTYRDDSSVIVLSLLLQKIACLIYHMQLLTT